MIVPYLILIIIALIIWLGLRKKWKVLLWTIVTLVLLILVGGYFYLKILGEAFGADCEKSESWTIGEYKIQEYKCLGWAGPPYYPLDLFKNNKLIKHGGSRKDSCTIAFSAQNDLYLIFNLCNNQVTELQPNKVLLDLKTLDSILIYSNSERKVKKLDSDKIQKFVTDWNESKIRGYSQEPLDSAFYFYPAYQYKLTVFSKSQRREFYGYNYLILDNSNWKYEMDDFGKLEYFNKYWNE